MKIDIEDGKYTYVSYEDGRSEVLRYSKAWKDVTGDKFLYCIAAEIMELQEQQVELFRILKQCQLALEPYDDIKPRDWKTDREKLAKAHQKVKDTLLNFDSVEKVK